MSKTQNDQHWAIAQITKQATTGTPISPDPDGWVDALPHLDGVACQFQPDATLQWSYLWFDDGYRAANLPSGLQDCEDRELDRHAAAALLDAGCRYRPVALNDVQTADTGVSDS